MHFIMNHHIYYFAVNMITCSYLWICIVILFFYLSTCIVTFKYYLPTFYFLIQLLLRFWCKVTPFIYLFRKLTSSFFCLDTQLYILLFGTTLTGVVVLLNYFQQKKKKKQDEERVRYFYFDNYFVIIISIEKRIFKMCNIIWFWRIS